MESEVNSSTIEKEVTSVNEHSVYLPVSEEMAKALRVGESVHVTFDGIVAEIDSGYTDEPESYSIRLGTQRVKIESENEYEKMAREDED
jgi:preprotein translocase subunit YajC